MSAESSTPRGPAFTQVRLTGPPAAVDGLVAVLSRRVLDLVAAQTPVAEAAEKAGVTLRQVYGRANWDSAFAEELDEAGWSLCVLGQDHPQCSTASGYRGNERSEAHRPACRGSGCREWRRGTSRLERAALA
ncbi:hypothetical protein ACF1BE_32170 [Streptomyces sp. NPDC014991]|uniref:hypothetical protein n=1 Tax=Streptomyces sp. NPDC014991 TaxID=3364935 RepID=UPI0037016981